MAGAGDRHIVFRACPSWRRRALLDMQKTLENSDSKMQGLKRVAVRFDKCRVCNKVIKNGSPTVWTKGGATGRRMARHMECAIRGGIIDKKTALKKLCEFDLMKKNSKRKKPKLETNKKHITRRKHVCL